jgi:hypothetical protein
LRSRSGQAGRPEDRIGDFVRGERVHADGDVGGAIERQAAVIAVGEVGLFGENGPGVLGALRRQPSAITMAPAVMSRPPARDEAVSFSPSSSQAKSMTRGTLSLSSGATREAGPNCRARK